MFSSAVIHFSVRMIQFSSATFSAGMIQFSAAMIRGGRQTFALTCKINYNCSMFTKYVLIIFIVYITSIILSFHFCIISFYIIYIYLYLYTYNLSFILKKIPPKVSLFISVDYVLF